ncbi:MAG: hypothetical protein WA971_09260, partial [Microbacterium sp.]
LLHPAIIPTPRATTAVIASSFRVFFIPQLLCRSDMERLSVLRTVNMMDASRHRCKTPCTNVQPAALVLLRIMHGRSSA